MAPDTQMLKAWRERQTRIWASWVFQDVSVILRLKIYTYLERCVEPNNSCRLETQAQAVGQREPVPELSEEGHADNRVHVRGTGFALHRDSNVSSTSIDDALGNGCTKLGQRVFVLVADNRLQGLSNRFHFRCLRLVLLDTNH